MCKLERLMEKSIEQYAHQAIENTWVIPEVKQRHLVYDK